jgi:hypothetical protein
MKKIIFLVLLCHLSLFAQQKSGITYSSHPALDAINAMNKAFVAGDLKAYETFFSPDVKIYSIGETKSTDLKRDLENSEWWIKNFDLTITRSEGVKPDVIQYEDNKKGVWVMDWTNFLAVHKISGDTVKTWFHDEYFVNNDNKITTWMTYYNQEDLGAQIQNSFGAHRNGRVYDEHPIIESVEAVIAAWVAGDPEKMATHFAADAKFYRLGEGDGFKGITLDEMKAKWTAGVSSTRERNMTVYGYPDAIYYEKGEGGWQVHSWWTYTNVDAKTGKESKGFVHMNHSFNSDRKISSELIWLD